LSVARRLVGRGFKESLPRFRVTYDGSERHFKNNVLTVGTVAIVFASVSSVSRFGVLTVLKLQQRPQVTVTPQDDMPAAAAVSAVRSTFQDSFCPVEVSGTGPTIS